MKISVYTIKILIGGIMGGLIDIIFGYSIYHWQFYVIIIPSIFVIITWIDILYYIHKRKRKYND